MSYDSNPNRKPFPRAYFIEPFCRVGLVHPLFRESKEVYYRKKNPEGFRHDLGALDIFLDNFGLLFAEQFLPPFVSEAVTRQYLGELMKLLHFRWDLLKLNVDPQDPYWGKNYNSRARKANSGEPRNLLRFIGDDDWSFLSTGSTYSETPSDAFDWQRPLFGEDGFHFPEDSENHQFSSRGHSGFLYADWHYEELLPQNFNEFGVVDEPQSTHYPSGPQLGGVILPSVYPQKVSAVRILHPKQATPDLPLRVGATAEDHQVYGSVVRDQGFLGTCVAHSVCTALDILARRKDSRCDVQFSPAWLHCATGDEGNAGRSLRCAVETVIDELPCAEEFFPYQPRELQKRTIHSPPWKTEVISQNSRELTSRFGTPIVKELELTDISAIKSYLAAGWLVVISTMLTDEFCGYGLKEYGVPLGPIKGQIHLDSGHAWLLVGYEHTDGNSFWKYQGRFLALNSWGPSFPRKSVMGEGVCSLPFAMLLTEGLEGFALRFR